MLTECNLIYIDCVHLMTEVPFCQLLRPFLSFEPTCLFWVTRYFLQKSFFSAMQWKTTTFCEHVDSVKKLPLFLKIWTLQIIIFRCSLPTTCSKTPPSSAPSVLELTVCIFTCFYFFMLFGFVSNWRLMLATLLSLLVRLHSDIGNLKESLQHPLFDFSEEGGKVESVKRYY